MICLVSLSCRTYLNQEFFPPDKSFEHRQENDREYSLGVVEFDDQGWYHSRVQAQNVFDHVAALARREPTIIVVFIHGWHHNACASDGNLACFRATLELLDREVNQPHYVTARAILGHPGKLQIAGIYLGWRGRSVPTALKYLTFWDRKAAGHRTGGSDLREFLLRLGALQRDINRTGPLTGLVTVAHSFGGAVAERALFQDISRPLAENVPITGKVDLREPPRLLEGFGDLVVLINPAFEASLYHNVADLSARATYASSQSPILLTLSAENDGPRKTVFPIGRFFSLLSQGIASREQGEAVRVALGNDSSQVTHFLKLDPSADWQGPDPASDGCGSGVELDARQREAFSAGNLGNRLPTASDLRGALIATKLAGEVHLYGTVLTPKPGVDPDLPFLVVQVSKHIINGHNGFFNPRLINFLVGYIARAEAKTSILRDQQREHSAGGVKP
jgi:hypothetical protein